MTISSRVFALVAAAFVAVPAAQALAAAPPSATRENALVRIERAFGEGRLDAPTRAIYALRAYKAPDTLPEELRPKPGEQLPWCATGVFRQAFREIDSFNAEQLAEYQNFAARPNSSASSNAPVNSIIVHYDAPTSAATADQVAAWADTAWNMEVTGMGFLAPLDDTIGGAAGGGSPDLDIYLQAGLNYAYTAGETRNDATSYDDASAFSVIDPAFPNLETYVAHEFNHTTQYAYDADEADSIYEMTAVFIEDRVYDSVNDYAQFIPDFQTHPERNLSFATYDDQYMYGAAIFLQYLVAVHGNNSTDAVRQIWENSEQDGTTNTKNYFQALEGTVLPSIGVADLQTAYQEFAGYRWLAGAKSDGTIPESSVWTAVAPTQAFTITNGADGNVTANPPQPLGANYFEVDPTGGVAGDRLTFTLHGGTGTTWGITTIAIPPSGAATVTPSTRDGGDGEVRVHVDGLSGYQSVVFAVTNLGAAGQAPDKLDTATPANHTGPVTPTSFTFDVFYSADGKDPAEAATGCKCDLSSGRTSAASGAAAMAIGLAAVVLSRRRRTA